jgi:hypothetical protein
MDRWYSISLSTVQVAAGRIGTIQDAFAKIFIGLGAPRDAGMFGSLALGDHTLFFSPGAVRIAKPILDYYGAVECAAPLRSEVAILAANTGAEQIPFAPAKE